MSVSRIVPNIPASDPSAGKAFYENIFGLETVMDQGWVVTLASKLVPSAQLTLVKVDSAVPHADYSIEVTDVDDCYKKARAANYEIAYAIRDEPWMVRRFFVRDPNGKIANVMSHRA